MVNILTEGSPLLPPPGRRFRPDEEDGVIEIILC